MVFYKLGQGARTLVSYRTMRLCNIKLSGFKSFVDPTNLIVPSSLVGIVGPNGCGKSNIIDAVTWVMGENHLLQLYLEGRNVVIAPYAFDEEPWSWGGSFVYGYSFGMFKIAAGIGRSPFVSATKSFALTDHGLGPVLDLWWRW